MKLLAVSYRGALAVDGSAYACVAGVLVCSAFLLAGSYLLNTYCDRAVALQMAPPYVPSAATALVCLGLRWRPGWPPIMRSLAPSSPRR
jgi:hypothetical protein